MKTKAWVKFTWIISLCVGVSLELHHKFRHTFYMCKGALEKEVWVYQNRHVLCYWKVKAHTPIMVYLHLHDYLDKYVELGMTGFFVLFCFWLLKIFSMKPHYIWRNLEPGSILFKKHSLLASRYRIRILQLCR